MVATWSSAFAIAAWFVGGSVSDDSVSIISDSTPAPYLACQGTEVVKQASWVAVKNLVESWMDLDLKHSRVMSRLYQAIEHNDAIEEHVQDCGFGVAVVLLAALRALEYDHGRGIARSVFVYLQTLLARLEPYKEAAKADGWDVNTTDLVIYPFLLALEPPHDCYGTKLRFYIYNIEDWTPAGNAERGIIHCQHGQWGLEALVPHWLRQGSCETEDPSEADYFFVPWHTWCDRMVYRLNQSQVPVGDMSMLYLNLMERKHELLPHWSRQKGRDHIFLFSDQGMNFFPEWRDYIPHSVFLTTEALTPGCGPSCYNPWKDVILPGHADHFRYRRMIECNKPSDQRDLLFNFHGRHPGYGPSYYKDNYVRGNIIEVFTGKHGVSVGGFVEGYFEIMGSSHFCLVPMGTSSWTNHLYESFFAGCIPVILSDDYGVPFEGDIKWEEFSIKWPMSDVSMDLYNFLLATPREKLRKMKAAVDAHACWFDYHQLLEAPGKPCSPYLGLIRALERKRKGVEALPGPDNLWGMQH
eukprot:TRINITY_DN22563_c0_g1_i1.p1 TRINITY_DN22563_c0_g1~~TRINITY_DN22563_c0_g1_i1.p1  ORF type:complete len:525 (-),score=33.80 TRINITY_DN22563_c0_g1_i1:50-1624(-)